MDGREPTTKSKRYGITALAVLGLLASAISASAVAAPLVDGLDLSAIPSVVVHRTDDLSRGVENYYPEVAFREQVGGFAVIDCRVSAEGELDACSIVAEYPLHCYFGAAAQKMAERRAITASPAVMSDHPLGSETVREKVVFNMFRIRATSRC